MYELRITTKDGKEFSPIFFDSIEKAIKAFKDNNEIGLMCALYNFK